MARSMSHLHLKQPEVYWLISVSYICNKINLNKYKLPRRDHDFNVIMKWAIYLFYILEIGL